MRIARLSPAANAQSTAAACWWAFAAGDKTRKITFFVSKLNLTTLHSSIIQSTQPEQLQQGQNISDERIMQLLGSQHSFDQGFGLLMQTYRERLYWQIKRIVQAHDDADDVLQNTFIKVYKGIGNFEGKSKLSTWLYRIATNEAITFVQSRARKNTDSLDAAAFQMANLEADTHTDGDIIAQLLTEAIETLPEKQRVVFNLRYFDELPYEEMSQVLDTSVGALKASFHHAVKKIERFLADKDLS